MHHYHTTSPSGKTTLLSRLREVAETPVSSSTFSQRVSGETAKGDKKSKGGTCGTQLHTVITSYDHLLAPLPSFPPLLLPSSPPPLLPSFPPPLPSSPPPLLPSSPPPILPSSPPSLLPSPPPLLPSSPPPLLPSSPPPLLPSSPPPLLPSSPPPPGPLSTVGVDLGVWKYRKDLEPEYLRTRKKGEKKLPAVTFYTWDFGGQVRGWESECLTVAYA